MAVLACYDLDVAIVPHPLRYGSLPPEDMLSKYSVEVGPSDHSNYNHV